MKRIITLIITLLWAQSAAAFGLWESASLGFGGSTIGLPAASAQTAFFDFNSSTGSATYSRASNAWSPESGLVSPHNLFLNSATGATQSITLVADAHTLSFKGTGSITIGGTGSGTLNGTGASDRVSLAFTPTAGSVSFTVTGSITEVVVCRGAYQQYIPTTSAAVYYPRYLAGRDSTAAGSILVEKSSTNKCTAYSVPRADGQYGSTLNSGTATLGKVYEIVTPTSVDWEAVGTRLSGTANAVGAKYLITGSLTFTANDTGKEAIDYAGTKSFYSGGFINNLTNLTLSGDQAAVLSVTTDTAAIDAAIAAESVTPTGMLPALMLAKNNGYKVYKLDNSTGSTASNCSIGGTNSVTGVAISIVARVATPHNTFKINTITAIHPGGGTYKLLSASGTAASTGYNSYVNADAGKIVYFLAPTLEDSPYKTTQILTQGAATTRAAATLSHATSGVIAATGGTVQGWWKPSAVGGTAARTIWSSYTDANNWTSVEYVHGTGYVATKRVGGTTKTVTHATAAVAGTWHLVTLIINADKTLDLYINGTAGATNTTDTTGTPVIASTGQIGSINGTLQADGQLDYVRFFSRQLTVAEALTYYNKGK